MGFSFSGELTENTVTSVENAFISQYLPVCSGNAVKVYLYGLYLCAKKNSELELNSLSNSLSLSDEEVSDSLSFLEEIGLISVDSFSPLSVTFLPVKSVTYGKVRRFKAEKYSDFTKSLQTLIPSRMISTTEFTEYFSIMESYKIQPEAMLLIVKYCVDKKGSDISFKYVSKVAKDFGEREINTLEKVEKELSSYVLKTSVIQKILSSLSIKRQPEIEDLNYLKKWTNELHFETENVIFASKQLKRGSMQKLDSFIMELFSLKCFSKEEIKSFFTKKQQIAELTVKINRALSIYVEVLDTEIETFVNKWISYGFTDETLLFIASVCFKSGKNSLQDMDELVERLKNRGFIDLSSVGDFFSEQEKADVFIKKLLDTCGLNRRPTPWDRENLATWKSWNFTEEMILEAGKLASGKSSPIGYMNGILSNWKNNGVFTVDGVSKPVTDANQTSQEEYNREYKNRRASAMSKAQKNLDLAMSLEGFSSAYERSFGIEKDLAFAEMENDQNKLNALETEKQQINMKIEEILKPYNLTIADLSPVYSCKKCNDTGYVGTHRCDCFDKK